MGRITSELDLSRIPDEQHKPEPGTAWRERLEPGQVNACELTMLRVKRRGLPFVALVVTMMLGLAASVATRASEPTIHAGTPVPVGNGVARVIVAADSAGRPTAVSVVLTAAALEGLPAASAGHADPEYILPMPSDAPQSGYDHVGLDWHPAGHVPAGIYTVPHLDVHFYLVTLAERKAVTFQGAAATAGLTPPDSALVPEDYAVPPDTAVEGMGLHGVDTTSHEFHGKPFDHTFIYGYYGGRLIFVEPMVTLDFLQTKPDVTVPVRTPRSYSIAAYYPTQYRIGFDPGRDEYTISIVALRPFPPSTQAAQR